VQPVEQRRGRGPQGPAEVHWELEDWAVRFEGEVHSEPEGWAVHFEEVAHWELAGWAVHYEEVAHGELAGWAVQFWAVVAGEGDSRLELLAAGVASVVGEGGMGRSI
jgi:hypothetical protein